MAEKSTLGQRVGALGGWIAGRWGIAPVATAGVGVTSPTDSTFSKTSAESTQKGERPAASVQQASATAAPNRTSNINRKILFDGGPDAHKRTENRISTHIEPLHLNNSLLQESLSEESVPTVNTVSNASKAETPAQTVTHTEPPNLKDSLLQESLYEERDMPAVKSTPRPILQSEIAPTAHSGAKNAQRGVRGRRRENRLSTHVEAVGVDGEALGEALEGL